MTEVYRIRSLVHRGLDFQELTIESSKTRGLGQLLLTGLPDAWLRDAKDKVRHLSAGIEAWQPLDRLLLHLQPADVPKIGAHLELPLTLACLASLHPKLPEHTRQILDTHYFVGALSLSGAIIHSLATQDMEEDLDAVGPERYQNLADLWRDLLDGRIREAKKTPKRKPQEMCVPSPDTWAEFFLYLASRKTRPCILLGPPGVGKTRAATRAFSYIKTPDDKTSRQVARLWRMVGLETPAGAPHVVPHAKSRLHEFIGVERHGNAAPGYFSLAHGGLLQLDEFPELPTDLREILRVILERGYFTRSTRSGNIKWPAQFWLIATANPCPCGFAAGRDLSRCRCLASSRMRYEARFSGPLLQRFVYRNFMTRHQKHTLPAFRSAPDQKLACHEFEKISKEVLVPSIESMRLREQLVTICEDVFVACDLEPKAAFDLGKEIWLECGKTLSVLGDRYALES